MIIRECRYKLIYRFYFRNHGIAPIHQLLLTLRFYALGTMLISVADFIGVSKTSACRIVNDVSAAIARLYNKYVYMQNNTEDDFYAISRFPRVLGALDCTHIRIQSPCKYIKFYKFYSYYKSILQIYKIKYNYFT